MSIDEILPLRRRVETTEFLDALFPTNFLPQGTTIESICEKLDRQRRFTHTSKGVHWLGWPAEGCEAADSRAPFVDAANAITQVIQSESNHGTDALWFASRPLNSNQSSSMYCWPDCILASQSVVNQLSEVEKDVQAIEAATPNSGAVETSKDSEESREPVNKLSIWWNHAHSILAISNPKASGIDKSNSKAMTEFRGDLVRQALTYMRRTLAEQLDRNFIFGLALCYDELVLLLLDRSGILQSRQAININEESWDTTMKLYRLVDNPVRHIEVPSYEALAEPTAKFLHRSHWVIDVIVNARTEKYATVRLISAMQSTEIRRSTMVFEVVKLDDLFKDGSDPE
ncbi:hypothetical protein DXG03_003814, partial [Asterophora parasitica]